MTGVRIFVVVAPVFGANCYLLADDDGSCAIVDPGAGAAAQVRDVVADEGLRPVAVLATHGHADHVWDAGAVADAYGIPLRLHAADAYRLRDPFGTLGGVPGSGASGAGSPHDVAGPLAQALAAAGHRADQYAAPSAVEVFGGTGTDGDQVTGGRSQDVVLQLGPLRVVARHAPGHTEGATLYLFDGADGPVACTGDVLFAGTVGRTDLPGGDGAVMAATLRDVVARLDPRTVVLPGHGPSTSVAQELSRNPYLGGGAR